MRIEKLLVALRKFHMLLFIGLVAFSSSCLGKINKEDILKHTQNLENMIQKGMNELNIPAVAYCISKGGETIHKACFGVAETGASRAIDENTVFPVASMSKNITAVLLFALIEDNKLKLEDKVIKYIPDFFLSNQHVSQNITILDLVSMGSGGKHFAMDCLFAAEYPKETIIKSLCYAKQIAGNFQKKYTYQNIIFGILGDIFEIATGEKYEDLVQKYLFNKLNMTNASAIPLEYEKSFFGYLKYRISRFSADCKRCGFFGAISDFFANLWTHQTKKIVTGHSLVDEKLVKLPFSKIFHVFPATSGISLSLNDLTKWTEMMSNHGAYQNKQLISAKNFEKMHSNITNISNFKEGNPLFPLERVKQDEISYGVGIFNILYGDLDQMPKQLSFHMGGIYGATACFYFSIDDDVSIGILCNIGGTANTLFMSKIAFQFFDLYFGLKDFDWISKELSEKELIRSQILQNYLYMKEKNLGAIGDFKDYVGTYGNNILDITISAQNNDLFLDNGIKKIKLTHVNRDIFEFHNKELFTNYLDNKDFVFFQRDKNNKINNISISCFESDKFKFVRKK